MHPFKAENSKILTAGLMFISLLGPQLRDFNPRPYVLKWLSSGHCAATDNQSRKCAPEEDDEQYRYKVTNIWQTYFNLKLIELTL